MSKGEEIIKLLVQGKTSLEIINMGYKKGTVYSAQRNWRKGEDNIPVVGNDRRDEASPLLAPQFTNKLQDIESDPEIIQLKKEIRIAELQKHLNRAKAPNDIDIIMAAAQELGQVRRDKCTHEENGLCTFWDWETADDVPKYVGQPVFEDEGIWRIMPSPYYCAMCLTTLEEEIDGLTARFGNSPLADMRKRFSCKCGAKGMVAVSFKCTKCEQENWWGWWPKEH